MHAPVGNEYIYEIITPTTKQITDIIPALIITALKFLNILIEVSAGNIIRLEISIVPIILIPTTIVTDLSMARNEL